MKRINNFKQIHVGDFVFFQHKKDSSSDDIAECYKIARSKINPYKLKYSFKIIARNEAGEIWYTWNLIEGNINMNIWDCFLVKKQDLILYSYLRNKSPRFFTLLQQ
jgi:hypothetical protein